MPATCGAPPEAPLQRRPAALGALPSAGMAATRPSPAGRIPQAGAPAPAVEPLAALTVAGPVRPGRRTKLLVKHLVPGDIALIDHLDVDRVSAEELIAAEVVAVVNCRPSSSGTYPNLGPLLLVEAGIVLVDMPDDALFGLVGDGDPLLLRPVQGEDGRLDTEVVRRGELLARGRVLDLPRVRADTEARRREVGEALERFARNTIEHMREERELLTGRIALPRFQTDFRDRSTLLVVRGVEHQRDIRALRPFIRDKRPVIVAVDGGADAVLEASLSPDMIVGDMDSASERALRCGAELI